MNLPKQNQKDRTKVGYCRLIVLVSVLFCFLANLRHSAYHHVKVTQVFAPSQVFDSFSDAALGAKDDECLSCRVGRALHLLGPASTRHDPNDQPTAVVSSARKNFSAPSFRSHILIPDSAGPPCLVA